MGFLRAGTGIRGIFRGEDIVAGGGLCPNYPYLANVLASLETAAAVDPCCLVSVLAPTVTNFTLLIACLPRLLRSDRSVKPTWTGVCSHGVPGVMWSNMGSK